MEFLGRPFDEALLFEIASGLRGRHQHRRREGDLAAPQASHS